MAKASGRRFAIGVDYGTNSVRALVVDIGSGDWVWQYPALIPR